MEFFPSREVFLQIGDISIRWYAICILSGAMFAYWRMQKKLVKLGYNSDLADDLFAILMSTGIIGARIWYVLFFDLSYYLADPVRIIRVWDGGLAIQGGLMFAAMAGYVYLRIKNISFLVVSDVILPYVLIAQACGRWGNFFNQEAYGDIVDESYFDGILFFLKDGMYIHGNYWRPMFFIESCLCIVGFILIKLYDKYSKYHRGDNTYCYLAWYGVIRFWIEAKRSDALYIGNLRIAQVLSIIFMTVGICGLLGVFRKFTKDKNPVIIFDLDGTLLDTFPVITASFAHVFAKYIPDYVITEQDKADFCGPSLDETFSRYIPNVDREELKKMYREHNTPLQSTVKTFPKVKETLQYLQDNGYEMAIASSKITSTIILGLNNAGISEFFPEERIVGYEQVIKPKPDPETINKALAILQGRRSNAIYIGDSAPDIIAAKRAGFYAIGFCSNELKRKELVAEEPNIIIEDFSDLLKILQEEHPWDYYMM